MTAVDKPIGGPAEPAVLVTGGTRGIGAGIARGFLRSGARVLVCGRTEPAELPSAGGRTAVFAKADIRDPEQAAGTVQHAVDLFRRLDVVVSNAGGSPYAAAATASPRFHAKVIELNLIAPLHIAQAANAVMQAPGRRIDHHGRQRERRPAVTGHGRVRRREGRPAPPGHQPRHRVGSRGQGQLRRAGLRGDRGGRRSSTGTRTKSPPSPRPCRCAGSRRRTTSPRRACSWRLPVPPTSAGRA